MAAWWDGIDFTVEVAFATNPLSTPTWVDVTEYVREIPSLFAGTTSSESSVSPASGAIIFSNLDRRFDPDYASSPYAPNVKPMRRCRITVELGAFTETVFTGFVTSWRNDWTIDTDGVSIATLTDSVWWSNAEPLPPTAYAAAVLDLIPCLYLPLQDPDLIEDLSNAGVTAAAVVNPLFGFPSFAEIGVPIGAELALSTTDEGAGGAVVADLTVEQAEEPRTLSMWFEGSEAVSMYYNEGAESGFLVYLDPTEIRVEYTNQTDDRRFTGFGGAPVGIGFTTNVPHHLVVTCDGGNLYTFLDGVLATTNALTVGAVPTTDPSYRTSVGFAAEMAVSHFAVFNDTLAADGVLALYEAGIHAYGHPIGETSGTRIGRVLDLITFPVGLRAIDAGVTIQGPFIPDQQDGIEYIRQVVDSERGLLFVDRDGALTFYDRVAMTDGSLDTGYVFSDDGASGAVVYDRIDTDGATVDTIRNIVTVSYASTGAITRRDDPSVAAYGAQRLNVDGNTMLYARDASNIAAFELSQKKDPRTRVNAVECTVRQVSSTQTATQVEKLLGLWIGDIVDVEITPRGVSPQVVKTVQVLGVRYQITPEQWYVTLYLAPAYDQTGWFTLDTSELDGADILLG